MSIALNCARLALVPPENLGAILPQEDHVVYLRPDDLRAVGRREAGASNGLLLISTELLLHWTEVTK